MTDVPSEFPLCFPELSNLGWKSSSVICFRVTLNHIDDSTTCCAKCFAPLKICKACVEKGVLRCSYPDEVYIKQEGKVSR